MKFAAAVIACVLYLAQRAQLLVSVIVAAAVSAAVTLIILSSPRFAPLAGYIASNGTTSQTWQLSGASGPVVNNNLGSLESRNSTNTGYAPFEASQVALSSAVGVAGSGGLLFSAMTGATALPTGSFSWGAAGSNTLSLTAAGNSAVSTTSGTIAIDGPTVSIGPTTASTVNIGNNASDPRIFIGDQTGGPQQVFIGEEFSAGAGINLNSAAGGATIAINATNFTLNHSSTDALLMGGSSGSGATLAPNLLHFSSATGNNDASIGFNNCNGGFASLGTLNITGQSSTNCTGAGGAVAVQGGTPSSGGNAGGAVSLTGGSGAGETGGIGGGAASITGGLWGTSGTGIGGAVNLTGGTSSTGLGSGDVAVSVPVATSSQGNVSFSLNASTLLTLGLSGFQPHIGSTIACGTGGTNVVPANSFGLVVTTGTLSSTCIINFATNASSGYYIVDLSGATPGATNGIEFENGSATYTATTTNHTSGATLAHVWTHGANTLAVSY